MYGKYTMKYIETILVNKAFDTISLHPDFQGLTRVPNQ